MAGKKMKWIIKVYHSEMVYVKVIKVENHISSWD